MGPITLFDKSFLEMLSVDQAALFDCLFSANLCPVFITEALADLSKKPPGQRPPEKIVSDLANKAPSMHSYPNAEHTSLCLAELFGERIRLDGFPATMGGRLVMDQGKLSVIYDDVEELEAFNRWQSGQFYSVEREFAKVWRERMYAVDHREVAKLARRALAIESRPKTLEDAHRIAWEVVGAESIRFEQLSVAFALLGLPPKVFKLIRDRWVVAGRPAIKSFAPYTAYCLHLEVFFHICVEKLLISPDRPSNRVDMAYLFYLPFCKVFVSQDKLHWRTAKLFMHTSQQLVRGDDLKADLIKLDAYFSGLPERDKREGLFRLASAPPEDGSFLTWRIWQAAGMKRREARKPSPEDSETHVKLLKAIRSLENAPTVNNPRSYSPGQLEQAVIKRMVPRRMGKWDMLPADFKG
ncbi:hypothetical protein [Devosia sp. A449]